MNAKTLYWRARNQFIKRNTAVLPQLQLQWGANERWFAREFAIAMNQVLCGSTSPTRLGRSQRYVDCEYGYGDISLWQAGKTSKISPLQLWEVKSFYSTRSTRRHLDAVVGRGAKQLQDSGLGSQRSVGLFFLVYVARDRDRTHTTEDHETPMEAFQARCRDSIRTNFRSDQNIRVTPLSDLTSFDYGTHGRWWTASWTTWGVLGRSSQR
jgi:hypothetical protein